MSLSKIVYGLSLAVSLSCFSIDNSYSQKVLAKESAFSMLANEKKDKGIIKPESAPDYTADIYVQRKKESGMSDSLHVGALEIRENSLYANLLYGYYQVLFEKTNDSTYIEQIYSKSLVSFWDRHEIFTTKKRKDKNGNTFLVLTDYETKRGKKREEKIAIEKRIFDSKYIHAIDGIAEYFKDNLPNEVNVSVLGEPYTFTQHERILEKRINGKEETTKNVKSAKMSEVVLTDYNTFIMKDYVEIYSTIKKTPDNVSVQPEKFEAKFLVQNLGFPIGFMNGEYKGIVVVKSGK